MSKTSKCHKFWETGVNPVTMKKDERPEDYIIIRNAEKARRSKKSIYNKINK